MIKPIQLHQSLYDSTLNAMTFLNEICIRYPQAISFAPGRPLEEQFDVADITRYIEVFSEYLRSTRGMSEAEVARELLQYGNTGGIIQPLIAQHLHKDEGIQVDPGDIVVTVGAQEAMVLCLRALCAATNDAVLVPEPCYVGIVGAAKLMNIPIVPVPESKNRLDIETLLQSFSRAKNASLHPKVLYLVPSYANPSGVSLTNKQRAQLIDFASSHDLFIVEDNPYGLFPRVPNQTLPTMKSMDKEGRVIYLGSFAKTGYPGARIGYAVTGSSVDQRVGQNLQSALAAIKSMITVNTPPIAQAVIGGMLLDCECSLKARTANLANRYSDNLNHLLTALDKHFAANDGVSWNLPDGGFFTVLEVPFTTDDAALERCAQQFGVLWTPMQHFYLGAGGETTLRLSSSLLSTTEISIGVERLAAFVASQCR